MGRAARTSISAASAAAGFSGFPHAAAPARSACCPTLSASPPRGAAIPAGGSAAGLYRGSKKRQRGRVSPWARGARLGNGGGQAAVCNAHSPSVRTGDSMGDVSRSSMPEVPPVRTSVPVADMESSAPERTGKPEPHVGHPREANWAPPPSPPTTSPAPAAGSCAARSC